VTLVYFSSFFYLLEEVHTENLSCDSPETAEEDEMMMAKKHSFGPLEKQIHKIFALL
jgi:hypothetical protein